MLDTVREVVETVTMLDISVVTRKKEYVLARALYFYHARKMTGRSLEAIGRTMHGKGHDTVIHALSKFDEYHHGYKFFRDSHYQVCKILEDLDSTVEIDDNEQMMSVIKDQNRILLLKNAELKDQIEQMSKIEENDMEKEVMSMLADIPEDRAQFFINNQLKTFLLMERSRVVQQYKKDQI